MIWRSFAAFVAWIIICAPCKSAEPIIIRFAMPAGLDAPATIIVNEFVSAINSRINGIGQVVPLQIGPDALPALRDGKIQIAAVPSGSLVASNAAGLAVFEIPFVLNDLGETAQLQRGVIGEAILASLANEQLVGLGYWNTAMRRLLGPQIRNAENLKGKKILTSASQQTRSSLLALGTSPVTIAAAEVYQALNAGAVDAVDVLPSFILNAKLYEAKPAIMEAGFRPQVFVIIATDSIWSKLPFQIQSVISEEVQRTNLEFKRTVTETENATFSALKDKGLLTVSWSPDDLTSLRRSVQNTVIKDDRLSKDKLVLAALTAIDQDQKRTFPKNEALDPAKVLGGRKVILFATDRKIEPSNDPNYRLGSGRGALSYGTVDIDLGNPRDAAAPSDNAQIKAISQFANTKDFRDALAQSLRQAERKEVLIYVHGFHNKFRDAVESTALLVDDLKFKGVPIVFSWPSDGTAIRYPSDEQQAETSRDTLLAFLSALKDIREIDRIHVLAHSMGGRVVGNALEWISTLPAKQQTPIYNVVFAAPDVYVTRFSQLLSKFPKSTKQITLYASKADQSLVCSQVLHDGARAGQIGQEMIVDKVIQTIDVSNAEIASFLSRIARTIPAGDFLYWLFRDSCRSGHSYVTRNFSVINDLHALIINDEPPDRRILLEMRPFKQHHYWEMRKVAQ